MTSKRTVNLSFLAALLSSSALAQIEVDVADEFWAAVQLSSSGHHEIAIQIFEQCAADDDARCTFSLGSYYLFGDGGIDIDYEKAFRYFEHGAELGYGPSEYLLSLAYRDGRGVDADLDAALEYLNAAARRCIPEAQHDMGEYYAGRDDLDNAAKAAAWYAVAADNGSALSATARNRILADGSDGFETDVGRVREEIEGSLECQDIAIRPAAN